MKLSRLGWLLAAFAATLMGVLAPQVPRYCADLTGASFPDALTALGSLFVLLLAAWVLLIAVLAMSGASTRVLARITPAVLRGALLAGAAGVLAVGPAQAAQVAGPEVRLPHSVNGLPLPDRPDAHASLEQVASPQTVTVRPGDTLWAIVAKSLPAGASDARIAAATRAWHRANRGVIGADPHLIFPTQRLTPPTGKDLP